MRSALAIDVFIHDFWAQRAFKGFFKDVVHQALKDKSDEKARFDRGEMSEDEASGILEAYHEKKRKEWIDHIPDCKHSTNQTTAPSETSKTDAHTSE